MTELELRKRYVSELETYLGAVEGDPKHRELIDWYNRQEKLPRGYRMTYTADWCVATAVAVAVKLGWTDIILPECSCTRAIELYRVRERFLQDRNYVPEIGDFLIYDWQSDHDPDHWGTVAEIQGMKMRIIEGNMADRVAYREVEIGDQRIYGYCLPDYGSRAGFSDVAEDAWYAEAVNYCRRNGLMFGKGDDIFDPEGPVTRGELAAVAMRLHRGSASRND